MIIVFKFRQLLRHLWLLIFTLQSVIYLSVYDIALPTNTLVFIDKFTKVLELHILNPSTYIQLWFPDFSLSNQFFEEKMVKYKLID